MTGIEENGQSPPSLTEWRVVMWLTLLGLAAANAWRIGGARFDPDLVVLLGVLIMAINCAAVFANFLASRRAFYAGLAGSILGAVLLVFQTIEGRPHGDRGDVLVREILLGGIGLSVGGLAGVSLGWVWDRMNRRKP